MAMCYDMETDEENRPEPNKRLKMIDESLSQPLSSSTPKRPASTETIAGQNKRAKLSSSEMQLQTCSAAGIVKKIVLTNFMCHKHFTITLNPRINFICGVNGSGKSAIQTGLVVGLGGLAAKTNRSSKVNGLVKHGSTSGSISIFLSNEGDYAYKREDYGNTIQVMRTISASSSNYKVYNQWGKLMSTSRKEIDKIISKFKINVNNPVTVLNQDSARNFLMTSKPEGRYVLFKKATLLEDTEDLLAQLVCESVEQSQRIETKKKAMKQMEDEMAKMSEKMILSEKLKSSLEEKFKLQNELMWSKVVTLRNEYTRSDRIKDSQERLKEEFIVELQKVEDEIKILDEKKRLIDNKRNDIENEIKIREDARNKKQALYKNKKKQFEEISSSYEKIEKCINALKEDYDNLRGSLDETERLEKEVLAKKNEAIVKKTQLNEELSKSENKVKILTSDLTGMKSNIEHFNDSIQRFRRRIDDSRNHIETLKRQIISMKNSANTLSMFDSWMPTLVKKIEEAFKANRFSQEPRGPIGRYIKVSDEKWIYAIEANLGHDLLQSFLVNNSNDRKVLYSIFDEVLSPGNKHRQPTVHCSAFQWNNRDEMLPKLETRCHGHFNILRSLTINDTVVGNFLMDVHGIHRILLVERDDACRNFIARDENVPPNCKMILNLQSDQFLPGFRVYANQDSNQRARILRKSATDWQKALEEEILENELSIENCKRESDDVTLKYQQNVTNVKSLQEEINSIKKVIMSVRREIQEIDMIVSVETPSLQSKLEEIREIQKELKQKEAEAKELSDKRNIEKVNVINAKNELNSEPQLDFFTEQIRMNSEIDEVVKLLNRLQLRANDLKKNINEQEQKIQILMTKLTNLETNINEQENAATQLSPEMDVIRSTEDIQRLIDEVEYFIAEAKKKLGGATASEFDKEYWTKKNNQKKFINTFKNLETLHERMEKMIKVRKQMILSLRDLNTSLVSTRFQTVLQSRNYQGNLVIDHKSKKLEIMVAPIDGGKNFMSINLLSGGEKSYSTVAFLLSLWSCMDVPFYSMDEYDVFMDAINRRTITQLLMEFANRQRNRQFIFLTPLDVSIIQISDDVQVHRVNKIQT